MSGVDLKGATYHLSSIPVRNAGMVIAQSFYKPLFERLGLLTDGDFNSEADRQKAISLLQYMVTGQQTSNESHLLLNKVLCGYPINESVETTIEIEESDIEMIESLIKTMIYHWTAIGNSSIEGFRGNWLVRDGTLTEEDDHWNLAVEKRAYDVLLNKAPFGFSTIKLPWMDKPLYVTWNY